MRDFDGRIPGSHGYLECTLATDLTTYADGEEIPPHKQVDVCLPNKKILRLPYAWLRSEGNVSIDVLDSMLDATVPDPPAGSDKITSPLPAPVKVTRPRAPGQ